ncbi:DnaJ-domain-containing protein [Pisolithus croceorrhizus]|nr:DnaJ-domain-containing protein [Pisolithus croceorrhizus]
MAVGLTLYDVLGVTPNATTEDVRKAYKLKALETHPDKLEPTASDRERRAAEGKFRNVCDAFEVLSDPVRRKAYDERINRAKFNLKAWDEERERRNREREAWVRQLRAQSEARIKALQDRYDSLQKAKEEKARYETMVEQFYQELRARNPEWEARRQEVLKRKALLREKTQSSK